MHLNTKITSEYSNEVNIHCSLTVYSLVPISHSLHFNYHITTILNCLAENQNGLINQECSN